MIFLSLDADFKDVFFGILEELYKLVDAEEFSNYDLFLFLPAARASKITWLAAVPTLLQIAVTEVPSLLSQAFFTNSTNQVHSDNISSSSR